jgi:hypothetical protein
VDVVVEFGLMRHLRNPPGFGQTTSDVYRTSLEEIEFPD